MKMMMKKQRLTTPKSFREPPPAFTEFRRI